MKCGVAIAVVAANASKTAAMIMYFNSENNDYEEFEYNGVKYIVYKSDENFYGVIWNDGTYVYDIYGSLTKSDIIKVAKCTK